MPAGRVLVAVGVPLLVVTEVVTVSVWVTTAILVEELVLVVLVVVLVVLVVELVVLVVEVVVGVVLVDDVEDVALEDDVIIDELGVVRTQLPKAFIAKWNQRD